MNKKQVMGLVIAAVIFVTVGIISVTTNTISGMAKKATTSVFDAGSMSYNMPYAEDFVAVIDVSGTIQATPESIDFFGNTEGYDHSAIMEFVDDLIDTENNVGIILTLDTPGGTVYESDELYLKLMEYKEKTGRPIWSYMESMCCSGGYYIASASDEMYANRNSWTGSIGVIISTYNMAELYDKIGIEEINIVSGDNKAMGHAGQEMSAEQRSIYQSLVDESYEQFVSIAAAGRGMNINDMKKLADGRIYTAAQAVDSNLIDGIKGYEEFMDYVQEQVGDSTTIYYPNSYEESYFSTIFGKIEDSQPKTDMQVIQELMNELGSGVPMYVYTGQ